MNALNGALVLARGGWPIFPCWPGEKTPTTRNGFKDATTDEDTVRSWWTRWPDANLAIATGAPGPDVLDVDNKPTGNGFAAFERLKRAGLLRGALGIVRTPSKGLHIYFRGTDQGNRGNMGGQHIDFRGRGGYVLAPPSLVNGKPYELVDWRTSSVDNGGACIDMAAVARLLAPRRALPVRHQAADRGDLTGLAAWLAKQQEGGRNSALYWAARRAVEAGAVDADFDALADAALTTGLPEREIRATIDSARRMSGVAR